MANEAIVQAGNVLDYATRDILEAILRDEDKHLDELEELQDQIEQMTLPTFLSRRTNRTARPLAHAQTGAECATTSSLLGASPHVQAPDRLTIGAMAKRPRSKPLSGVVLENAWWQTAGSDLLAEHRATDLILVRDVFDHG